MINEKNVRALYSSPQFAFAADIQASKPKKKRPDPTEPTLNTCRVYIGMHKGITRIKLHKASGLSLSTLNRCFKWLLEHDEITRVDIGNAGAYKVYEYYMKECEQ